MTRVRPVPALNKPRAGANAYRSSCSICRLGIFQDQPHEWVRQPVVGLIHTACKGETTDG